MIKRFYEMVDDDTIGTIRDIIESKILDDYDVNLIQLGICRQTKLESGYRKSLGDYYKYELPNGETMIFNQAGFRDDNVGYLYPVKSKSFVLIQLDTREPLYLLKNMEIFSQVKNSFDTIRSMTNLAPDNPFLQRFQNGISLQHINSPSLGNYLRVNWNNMNIEYIRGYLDTFSSSMSKSIISIVFEWSR